MNGVRGLLWYPYFMLMQGLSLSLLFESWGSGALGVAFSSTAQVRISFNIWDFDGCAFM
jgi:hypothetical protein